MIYVWFIMSKSVEEEGRIDVSLPKVLDNC